MKIKRDFGNVSFEFDLSWLEIKEAYREYQHKADFEDVVTVLDMYHGDKRLTKSFESICDDKKLIEEFIIAYRKAMDNYDGWDDVCYLAIGRVLVEKGLMREE